MRRVALLLVVVTLSRLASAPLRAADPPPMPPDLPGIYLVEGNNPDGNPYRGLVEISMSGRLVTMHWKTGPTEEAYGYGFVSSGRLVVTVLSDTPGVVLYTVEKGSPLTLAGEWTLLAAPDVYRETLTKMPAHPDTAQAPEKKPPPSRKGEKKG